MPNTSSLQVDRQMRNLVGGICEDIRAAACLGALLSILVFAAELHAELPSPALNNIFPAGCRVGTSVGVIVEGGNLDGLTALRFADPRIVAQKGDGNQFTVTIPSDIRTGVYDVRVVGKYGVSAPRAFLVGNRPECREAEPNDSPDKAQAVALNDSVNGRLDKPGDIDCYRFTALAGQRVVLEVWAQRLDSPLHGVLEVFSSEGQRVAVNRGHAGVDPLVDFLVPADGEYVVRLFDQTYLGSGDHVYRLDIDTGPRVEFVIPAVVRQGEISRVTLFGRNLLPRIASAAAKPPSAESFDQLKIELPPSRPGPTPLPLRSTQTTLDAFAFYPPGGHLPVLIGVTDLPVVRDMTDQRRPEQAQEIAVPSEVSGQLVGSDERDWFAVQSARSQNRLCEAPSHDHATRGRRPG